MKKKLANIRGPIRMTLAWVAVGAFAGMLVELTDNIAPGALPFASAVDIWPPVLAVLGFAGGAVCSLAVWLVGLRRVR